MVRPDVCSSLSRSSGRVTAASASRRSLWGPLVGTCESPSVGPARGRREGVGRVFTARVWSQQGPSPVSLETLASLLHLLSLELALVEKNCEKVHLTG